MKTIITNPHPGKEPGNVRDPFIINHQGAYYMVATIPPFWKGEVAGVKMWSSQDLVNWKSEGLMIRRDDMPEDAWCRDRFWAPELFIKDGKFYLLFSAGNEVLKKPNCLWLARADSITGPYVMDSVYEPVNWGIDGDLFEDDDGQIYLTLAWGGIYLCKFDLEKGKPCSEPVKIVAREEGTGTWDDHPYIEGNTLIKRNGMYYLWYSAPGRSYEMGWATTDHLSKPFTKWPDNPVLSGLNTPCHASGHNCCFKLNDGRDAVAFHGHADGGEERLCIDVVTYPMASRAPALQVEIDE